MVKFHVKGQWDSIRHDETIFIQLLEQVDTQYDDDIIEFDLEIKNIKSRHSTGKCVELRIKEVK